MPRDYEHLQKARLNEAFADALDKSTDIAELWSVVVAFYSALHYVQRYFVTVGAAELSYNHENREKEIQKDPKLKFILPQYKYLYKMSHVARYKCAHFPSIYPKPYVTAEGLLRAIKGQVDRAMTA